MGLGLGLGLGLGIRVMVRVRVRGRVRARVRARVRVRVEWRPLIPEQQLGPVSQRDGLHLHPAQRVVVVPLLLRGRGHGPQLQPGEPR